MDRKPNKSSRKTKKSSRKRTGEYRRIIIKKRDKIIGSARKKSQTKRGTKTCDRTSWETRIGMKKLKRKHRAAQKNRSENTT
jgi:hypothetical protein